MIELKSLLLCDAASVREGLLHVLGGGITIIWRASYPDAFLASLAASFELSEVAEGGEDHSFRITAVKLDGENEDPIFEAGLQVHLENDGSPGHQTLPIVINLSNAGIASEGQYEIRAFLDEKPVGNIHFAAKIAPDVSLSQPFG